MPHISARKLHARDYMSRALRRAGQFAHVSHEDIEQTLSDAYSWAKHFKADDEAYDWSAYISEAVPLAFVKAFRAKAIPPLYDAVGTMRLFSERHGSLCAVCFSTRSFWRSRCLGRAFGSYVCPTFLWVDGKDVYHSPFCEDCGGSLHNWAWRVHGQRGESSIAHDPTLWAAGLAWLSTSTSFKRRLQQNRYVRPRFDPRKIPMRREAA